MNFWIRFTFHDFRFHIPCFENPFVFVLFSFLFWRLPLIGGGGGCIRPIVARVTWDFACVFVCFGSGILFVSLEKVFILALEGTRFPSLLTPQITTCNHQHASYARLQSIQGKTNIQKKYRTIFNLYNGVSTLRTNCKSLSLPIYIYIDRIPPPPKLDPAAPHAGDGAQKYFSGPLFRNTRFRSLMEAHHIVVYKSCVR